MGPMRPLGRLSTVLLALPLALSGCTSEADDAKARQRVEDLRADVVAATEELLDELVPRLESPVRAGNMRYSVCGGSIPRAAIFKSVPQLEASPLPTEQTVAEIRAVLAEQGWAVEEQPNPAVLRASRDELDLRVQAGEAATSISIETPCVDMSRKQAEELADLPTEEIPRP